MLLPGGVLGWTRRVTTAPWPSRVLRHPGFADSAELSSSARI